MRDSQTVGGRLETARVAAGASVRGFARKLGVTHAAVYHWETGRRSISSETLAKACRLLGVTPGWVLGLTTEGGPGTAEPAHFGPLPKIGRPRDAVRLRSPRPEVAE